MESYHIVVQLLKSQYDLGSIALLPFGLIYGKLNYYVISVGS